MTASSTCPGALPRTAPETSTWRTGRNDRIQKFSADGEFLKAWTGSDAEDGAFNRPSGLAVDANGVLYVADWGNERVQVLTQDGGCLANLRGESGAFQVGPRVLHHKHGRVGGTRKGEPGA